MKVIYRFHDKENYKVKEPYLNKIDTLKHFLKIFKENDIYIVADNIQDSTYEYLKTIIDEKKIIRSWLGGHGSFIYSVEICINNFDDNDKVYFAEDDYIYTKDAPKILEDGLDIAEYVSGYDHPDKYINHNEGGDNPFVKDGGEETRVMLSKSRHWKLTNSACMTFGTKVKTIKMDIDIYRSQIYDFPMWRDLIENRNRRLISCIPAVSSHGETKYLSPFIDWKKEYMSTM
jgi:hypothetical protein